MNATLTQVQAGTAKGLVSELLRVGQEALMRSEGVYVRVKVLDAKKAWGATRFEVAPVGGVGALWVDAGRLAPAGPAAPAGDPTRLPSPTLQNVIDLIERAKDGTSDECYEDCVTALRWLREMKQDAEAVEGSVTRAELVNALATLSGAVSGTTAVLSGSLPGCAAEIRKAQDAALSLLARIPAAERAA